MLHLLRRTKISATPTIDPCMTTTFSLDDLAARTEALLSRYEALAHAHTELQAQLNATLQERDSLRLRLQAARARIETLIAQLPVNQSTPRADPEEA